MDTGSAPTELDSIGDGWVLLVRIDRAPKQSSLAASIGLDAGTFSDFKNNKAAIKISHFKALLKALNLKLVDADARCVNPETFRVISRLAANVLLEQPQLTWEDAEK